MPWNVWPAVWLALGYQREDAVFDSNDLSAAMERITLTPTQAGIGLGLQQYYQFVCVGPTPERMRMLLVELNKRAQAGSAS
jgi:hypothetical protein